MKHKVELVDRENIKDALKNQNIEELRKRLFAWEALHKYTFMEEGNSLRGVWCAWCMKMILTLPSKATMTGPTLDKLLAHPCFNINNNIPEEKF